MAVHATRIALLATLAVWTFSSPGAVFVYEDFAWRHAGDVALGPRALTQASWYVLAKLWPGPEAAHLLNVLLHGIVAVLAWHLARRLRLSADAAYVTAALVLLHPLTAETVAYAAQRGELFAAIGVLTVCLLAAGKWWQWPTLLGIIGAVAFGLLGKESAIVALWLMPLTLWVKGRV